MLADVAWGFGFLLVAITSLLLLHEPAGRPLLVTALVAVWAIRLSLHVHFRNRDKPEDFRYRKWREEWGSSFYTSELSSGFRPQSILLVLVSTPVIYVSSVRNPPLAYSDVVGVLVWMIGFFFEPLATISYGGSSAIRLNKGRIMTSGTVALYASSELLLVEVVVWWGIFLIALFGTGWMAEHHRPGNDHLPYSKRFWNTDAGG